MREIIALFGYRCPAAAGIEAGMFRGGLMDVTLVLNLCKAFSSVGKIQLIRVMRND